MFIEYVEKLDATTIVDEQVFDELYQMDNEFERTQKINELEDRAKLLGVKKSFDNLLKVKTREYTRLIKAEAVRQTQAVEQPRTYITMFSKEDMTPLKCGSWVATDEGVYTLHNNERAWACPHPIYPEAVLVNAETGICKVKLWFKVRGKWRYQYVERKAVASNNGILKLADFGVRVNVNNARALVQYLTDVEALNEEIIEEKMSTSRLGWINGEIFMPYGDDIVFDNENSMRSLFESIKAVGDRDTWYNMIKGLRQEGKIEIMVYLAASLASVLVEPVGALPFIVDLWGETGKGKTVALMVAASIWADPSEGAYMADAKATNTAMEIRLNVLNSLPMLIDDLAQVSQQYDEDFSALVYRWCSGRGRDRSNIDLGLNKATAWKNCILTNAEHSMVTATMQGGAVNRIIDIEMADGYLFEDGHEVSEVVRNNYGFAGREFIDAIQNIGFDEVRRIQKGYAKQIKDISKERNVEKEEKQILPMSIILTADELAEKYLYQDGVRLNINECIDLLKTRGEVSEHERAYNFLVDQIAINRIKFNVEDVDNYRGEEWGITLTEEDTGDEYCIIIGTIFARMLKDNGFQDKAFCSWALRRGLIKGSVDGKSRINYRLHGSQVRCVFLKLPSEEEIEEEEYEKTPFDD